MTTRGLVVRGLVPAGTGPLRISLESRGGKALRIETVEPMPRLGQQPQAFAIELPVGGPRPGGILTVQVVAYDDDGVPIDGIRRRVVLGPIERTVGGEDGLMGGLVGD